MGRAGIEAGGGDGWGVIGEHVACVVKRRAGLERNAAVNQKAIWVTVHGASIYIGQAQENHVGCEATGWDSLTSIGFTHIDRECDARVVD